jgi:hypothetical protein
MKLALVLLCVPALAFAGDSKSESKKVSSADGSCSITVPTAWQALAVVAHPKAMDTFDEVKSGGKALYKGRIIKDTATELEIEGPSAQNGKPSVYRAIASGKTYCLTEVDYDASTADDARRIAHSLSAK